MNIRYKKVVNSFLVLGVLVALYLWGSVYQNSLANPLGSSAQISFLDVGEGDSALINLPGSIQILIDGGRSSKVLDPLSKRMPKNDRKIEYVIESHPDADHIGGLTDVLKAYEVGEIVKTNSKSDSQTYANLESQIESNGIQVRIADKGEVMSFGGAIIKVLSPKEDGIEALSSNNSSLVLRMSYQSSCVMFTGDAEIEAQQKIKSEYSQTDLKCELFKVAHHGSAGAYEDGLTKMIDPMYAVISVGSNGYGHPASSVISSLEKLGIEVLRTDQKGTVDFVLKGEKWSLK
jgi:beta-lactamase superfamily II metal-dependent hydrolase